MRPLRLFDYQEDSVGVCETRKLGQHHDSRSGKQPWDLQGGDAASTAQAFGHCLDSTSNGCSRPLNAGPLGVISGSETGTSGAGAEMSPPIAGGYHHGEVVGGGNGGSIPINRSGVWQESGHKDGLRPLFRQQRCMVPADSPRDGNFVRQSSEQCGVSALQVSFVPRVVRRI